MAGEIIVTAYTCLLLTMGLMTLTTAIPIRVIKAQEVQEYQETPFFQKPVCPTATNLRSISMDIGCEADFNYTVLTNMQTLIMKCRPVVKNATCEWSYNNIVLGNSTDYAVSFYDTHTFKMIAYPVTSLEIDIGLFTYLPGNTITCTCTSSTINKTESRSTCITSNDFAGFSC